MVLFLDYAIYKMHHFPCILPSPTSEAVTLVPRNYLKLVVLYLLCEVIQVQLKFILYLSTRNVSIGHHQSIIQFGDGEQARLEITKEHFFF